MTPLSVAADSTGPTIRRSFCLDEEAFQALYDRTAPALSAYLKRLLNGAAGADDLLQESYLRLLQAKLPPNIEFEHLKNYLFRIATNLARTELSRRKPEPLIESAKSGTPDRDTALRTDVAQSLNQLNPRHRELLWLAYVERFSHQEIASIVGAKTPSIRPMLARARSALGEILKKGGFRESEKPGVER